jgi:hypothetical protein
MFILTLFKFYYTFVLDFNWIFPLCTCTLAAPRNAPAAKSVASKDVALSHFVFRLDYNDWKVSAKNLT